MNSDITSIPFCCCGELQLLDHYPAAARNRSRIPGQPPSTSLRNEAPPSAPIRSNFRCSSSTRARSEEHTSELQSHFNPVSLLLLHTKKLIPKLLHTAH